MESVYPLGLSSQPAKRVTEDSRLRRTANCGGCGRFVGPRNFNAVYDGYAGGWEWDPMCDTCERPALSGRTEKDFAATDEHSRDD